MSLVIGHWSFVICQLSWVDGGDGEEETTEVVTTNEDKITTEVVTTNEDKITTEVVTTNEDKITTEVVTTNEEYSFYLPYLLPRTKDQ
ncbi:hypothetical protein [Oscillatoria sp. HE19RPO]|uniref:hypothetical protein n=1 Tax=Oscillatoria sp. HE19RPO TaxID=2954806 RepID=UPI0020C31673|nr:hypothetical protein [Oscillatoria sp. HE19RPO]